MKFPAQVSIYQVPEIFGISSSLLRLKDPPVAFGSLASLVSESTYVHDISRTSAYASFQDERLHVGVLDYIKKHKLYFMSDESVTLRRRWFLCMTANIAIGIFYFIFP